MLILQPNILYEETGAFKAYQYHVGTLNSVPISYGNGVGFDGISMTVDFSTQLITEEGIAKTFEKCTETIASASINGSVSVLSPWESMGLEVGIETSVSESIKNTKTKSVSFTKSKGTNISYTLNDDYCKVGYKYRLVLTSAFEVYYIVVYDKVVDKIYEYYNMEEIPNEQTFYIEECPKETLWKDNNFNPVIYPEVDPIKDDIKVSNVLSNLSSIRFRDDEKKITDSGRFNQHHDDYSFTDLFNYNSSILKEAGYKTLKIELQMDIKEVDDGYQYIMIYAHSDHSGDGVDGCTIEHGGTKKNTSYKSYSYVFTIDLNKFNGDVIVIRYGASGDFDDDWKNKNLKVVFTISK